MTGLRTLLVAVLVVVSAGAVAAVPASGASSPQATQDGAVFTVQTGSIQVEPGGRICAQRVDADTNKVVLHDVTLTDVTIYQGAENVQQRTEIASADVEGKMVLYTNGENGKVDTLAKTGQCITMNQADTVVEATYVTSNAMETGNTSIVGGSDVADDAPEPGGFELPPRFNQSGGQTVPDAPVDAPGPATNLSWVDNATDGVTGQVNDTLDQTTDRVNNTVDNTTDRVNDTVNRTTGQVNDTVDQVVNETNDTVDLQNATNGTVDRTTDRVNDTVGTVENTTDGATNGTEDTLDEAKTEVDNTTDEVQNTTNDTTDTVTTEVDNTTDDVQNTTDDTTDTVTTEAEQTTNDTTDTVENTTNDTTDTTNDTVDVGSNTTDDTTDAVENTTNDTTDAVTNTTSTVDDTTDAVTTQTATPTVDDTVDTSVGYVAPWLPALDGLLAGLADLGPASVFTTLAGFPALVGLRRLRG